MATTRTTGAQGLDGLPFTVGERIEYDVRAGRVASGRGTMTVNGPEQVRGTSTYVLRFDFQAGLGFVKASDHTSSWLDPVRMSVLRFQKRERAPLSQRDEAVELYPEEHRWQSTADSGQSGTAEPLDELSFIYFLRTLPLVPDTVYEFARHYRADRNPVLVRIGRQVTVMTGLGPLQTTMVEMQVRDPRRFGDGHGVIRIYLTDDAWRVPARIESEMPVVGRTVMTLTSWQRPGRDAASGKP